MLLKLESPVTTAHRAKLAYIYVRQSTAGQVRQHQESTELQYRLVDRAVLFGWPKERIEVIDDDLGKSGTSSDSRGGFQRLIAEIGLGKAGLVLSLDASRLARNNHDWHQLALSRRTSSAVVHSCELVMALDRRDSRAPRPTPDANEDQERDQQCVDEPRAAPHIQLERGNFC